MTSKGVSIIICTYNPRIDFLLLITERICSLLKDTAFPIEVILVDNNSDVDVGSLKFIQEASSLYSNFSIVKESNPGLTNARLKGYSCSTFNWLAFIDDDNLPSSNYFSELYDLTNKYEKVKCWGAGKIDVKYVDSHSDDTFLHSIKHMYQQRCFEGINISNSRNGEPFYPPGTGLCIEKSVFEEYANLQSSSVLTFSDRKGSSLSSAGDTQLVYLTIKNGFYVGSSGRMEIIHLIDKRKTRLKYIFKLAYALNSAQIKAYNEVFNDKPILVSPIENSHVLTVLYILSKKCIKNLSLKEFFLEVSERMGQLKSSIDAGGYKTPFLLKTVDKLLR